MPKKTVARLEECCRLEDLPNVGKSIADNLRLMGIQRPAQLKGQDPLHLYRLLSEKTGQRQDPCVLDVFLALAAFAAGGGPQPWWAFSAERKARFIPGPRVAVHPAP